MKVPATLVLALLGCATASEDFEGVAPGRNVRDGGGGDGADEEDETSSERDSGVTTDSGSSTTDSGAMTTDSEATDTGSPAGPGVCSTLGYTECLAATSLGSISGDKGAASKTESGSDSKFFQITLTEDDSSVFSSKDLKVRITLASTGGNFDLYTYLGPPKGEGGGVECTTTKASSTNPAGDDLVALSWNDNRPIGGLDDSRVVSIEVRATMPKCDAASWTLKIEGNK